MKDFGVERDRSPQSRIESPFSGPRFVQVLAGIRRPVVHMMTIEQDDLVCDSREATWKKEFKLPWREAGPPHHLGFGPVGC